jgi:hypothetical protein
MKPAELELRYEVKSELENYEIPKTEVTTKFAPSNGRQSSLAC